MMHRYPGGYLSSTRHPWPCLVFLLPLLAAYETGVLCLGGAQPDGLRNGADAWLRWGLEAFGFPQLYWAPVLIIVVFLGGSWIRRWDRPRNLLAVCRGMLFESLVFAGGLFGLSRALVPLLNDLGIRLNSGPAAMGIGQVITFVGAGIYEEVLFRLLLFLGLGCLLRLADVPRLLAAVLTTIASAALFAVAHHLGPYGEAFDGSIFLFRALAGFYFAVLYQFRGFGIAVGTHTCYDVLVGVLVI